MKTAKCILIVMLLGFLAAGATCQNQGTGDSFVNWSPKQKAAYFMGLYSGQYDLYKAQAAYPDLTAQEKTILQTKKKILVQAYPLIQAYDMLQAAGGVPSIADENAIISLLDQLQRAAIRTAK
jgi:hypothetical protein